MSVRSKLVRSQIIGAVVVIVLSVILVVLMHIKGPSRKARPVFGWSFVTDTLSAEADKDSTKAITLPPLRLHDFDPNTVDSIELLELGFSVWQTRAFLKYRRAGKHWYKKEQMKTLYGLTDSAYLVLEPYIHIEEKKDSVAVIEADSAVVYERKVKKDTVLELNSADTTTLQYIRGIGWVRASYIVARREELGGYSSVEQLVELMQLYPKYLSGLDTLLDHFVVEKDSIKPLYINQLSARRLMKHPYVSYTLAKDIERYRYRFGPIKNEKALRRLPCLRNSTDSVEAELNKLLPYLSFEVQKGR